MRRIIFSITLTAFLILFISCGNSETGDNKTVISDAVNKTVDGKTEIIEKAESKTDVDESKTEDANIEEEKIKEKKTEVTKTDAEDIPLLVPNPPTPENSFTNPDGTITWLYHFQNRTPQELEPLLKEYLTRIKPSRYIIYKENNSILFIVKKEHLEMLQKILAKIDKKVDENPVKKPETKTDNKAGDKEDTKTDSVVKPKDDAEKPDDSSKKTKKVDDKKDDNSEKIQNKDDEKTGDKKDEKKDDKKDETKNGDKKDDDKDKKDKNFVAVITFNKGKRNKVIKTDGSIARCAVNRTIKEGDKIKVSSRGKITIVYKKTGLYRTLKPGEEHVVSVKDESAETTDGKKLINKEMMKNIKKSKDELILAAVAGTRERRDPNQPFPISPRNTLLLQSTKIVLVWETPDNKASKKTKEINYRIHILRKGKEIFSAESTKNTYELDVKQVKLKKDTLYMWYVERTDMPKVAIVKPLFKFVSDEITKEMNQVLDTNLALTSDKEDGGPYVLNARYLAEKKVYKLALDYYVECYILSPGEESLLKAIEETYEVMGFYPKDIKRFIETLKKKYPVQPE